MPDYRTIWLIVLTVFVLFNEMSDIPRWGQVGTRLVNLELAAKSAAEFSTSTAELSRRQVKTEQMTIEAIQRLTNIVAADRK